MSKKKKIPPRDKHLLQALTRAYTARAKLFHNGVISSKVDLLLAEIDAIPTTGLVWDLRALGISKEAFAAVQRLGANPHQVFAHDTILAKRPHLIAYYRNLAAISRKGIAQLLFSTERYESGRLKQIPSSEAKAICRTLNAIMSGVIDSIQSYQISIGRQVILAEIGAMLQGSWANAVGTGATREVERVLVEYAKANNMISKKSARTYVLKNGWRMVFGSEPDVAFYDSKGQKQIAMEIKGSLDKAGAQTRYGEARKSFA